MRALTAGRIKSVVSEERQKSDGTVASSNGKKRKREPVASKETNSKKSKENSKEKPRKSSCIFASEQDANTFRRRKLIKVYGEAVPFPNRRFSQMALPEWLLERIPHAKPTLVQMQATPILQARRDALVIAPTGSGKTLAYLLAIFALLRDGTIPSKPRALVIAPTRELAQQIWSEAKALLAHESGLRVGLIEKALVNNWRQQKEMDQKICYPDLLISSPLGLIHAVEDGLVSLAAVEIVVMDEGDKLLELGYLEQLDTLLGMTMTKEKDKGECKGEDKGECIEKDKGESSSNNDQPKHLQKVLFSATIPSGIEQLARTFMAADLVKVVIGRPNASVSTIHQRLMFVGQEAGKLMAIQQMLLEGSLQPPAIIFCETIVGATNLYQQLSQLRSEIPIEVIHGHRTTTERATTVRQFRDGKVWILITTEVLARGLDFPALATVINYDFPPSTASYIHRIGRTGRAGRKGHAVTFFKLDDAQRLRVVVNVMRQTGCEVPEWMLQVRQVPKRQTKKKRKRESNKIEIE